METPLFGDRGFQQRVLHDWACLHSEQLHAGDDYPPLRPTDSICVLNLILCPQVEEDHLTFRLLSTQHGLTFTDDMEVLTIELPMRQESVDNLDTPLDRRAYFLSHAASGDASGLPRSLATGPIRHAFEDLVMVSHTGLERERNLARFQLQRDERWRLTSMLQQGREQGRREQLVRRIQTFRRLLGVTAAAPLDGLTLTQLEPIAEELEQRLADRLQTGHPG